MAASSSRKYDAIGTSDAEREERQVINEISTLLNRAEDSDPGVQTPTRHSEGYSRAQLRRHRPNRRPDNLGSSKKFHVAL